MWLIITDIEDITHLHHMYVRTATTNPHALLHTYYNTYITTQLEKRFSSAGWVKVVDCRIDHRLNICLIYSLSYPRSHTTMADLHNDITYDSWGKTSAAGHRECMQNSKCVLERSISLLHGKTDRLHALIIATWRGGVFVSEANDHIGVQCVAFIAWKPPIVELMMTASRNVVRRLKRLETV